MSVVTQDEKARNTCLSRNQFIACKAGAEVRQELERCVSEKTRGVWRRRACHTTNELTTQATVHPTVT